MSRLLSTRLPIADNEVTADTYNKLVRVLELNLGSFNPDKEQLYGTQR